jgi:hypothetical protein
MCKTGEGSMFQRPFADRGEYYSRGVWHACIGLEALPGNACLTEGTPAYDEYLRGYNDTKSGK